MFISPYCCNGVWRREFCVIVLLTKLNGVHTFVLNSSSIWILSEHSCLNGHHRKSIPYGMPYNWSIFFGSGSSRVTVELANLDHWFKIRQFKLLSPTGGIHSRTYRGHFLEFESSNLKLVICICYLYS